MSAHKKDAQKVVKRTKKRKITESEQRNREILGVILIGLGLFFLLALFEFTGSFGEKINNLGFGLFGFFARFMPFSLMIFGILIIIASKKEYHLAKFLLISFVIIAVCSFFHVSYINKAQIETRYFEFLKSSFDFGVQNFSGGGFFGAFITYWIVKLFGQIGSYIFFAALLLMDLIVLANLFTMQKNLKITQLVQKKYSQARKRQNIRARERKESKKKAAVLNEIENQSLKEVYSKKNKNQKALFDDNQVQLSNNSQKKAYKLDEITLDETMLESFKKKEWKNEDKHKINQIQLQNQGFDFEISELDQLQYEKKIHRHLDEEPEDLPIEVNLENDIKLDDLLKDPRSQKFFDQKYENPIKKKSINIRSKDQDSPSKFMQNNVKNDSRYDRFLPDINKKKLNDENNNSFNYSNDPEKSSDKKRLSRKEDLKLFDLNSYKNEKKHDNKPISNSFFNFNQEEDQPQKRSFDDDLNDVEKRIESSDKTMMNHGNMQAKLLAKSVEIFMKEDEHISGVYLQHKLQIESNYAMNLIQQMQSMGIISKPSSNKPRKILIDEHEFEEIFGYIPNAEE